jgi:endonuclease III
MKVKITKSKLLTMWYIDKIGEVFEVEEYIDSIGMYKIKQKNINEPSFVYAEDVEKIK